MYQEYLASTNITQYQKYFFTVEWNRFHIIVLQSLCDLGTVFDKTFPQQNFFKNLAMCYC